MTGINHATTGALIGTIIAAPVALPLALLSHIALDMLPHYGDGTGTTEPASKQLQLTIRLDFILVIVLLVSIVLLRPAHWPIILGAALMGMSLDVMWLPDFIRGLRNQPTKEQPLAKRLHQKIQWCERPWGIAVELIWLAGIVVVLANKW